MDISLSFRLVYRWTLPALASILAAACNDSVVGVDPDQDLAKHTPAAPTTLQITVLGPSSLRLTWQDNADDEVGFRILRGPAEVALSVIRTVEADVGAYDDTGLTPLTTYHYRVVAFNDQGESAGATTSTMTPADASQCPGADAANRVLVDASKDGGVWWFPQGGSFDPDVYHQGTAVADYLRSLGYVVTELGRDQRMTDSLALAHRIIIRAHRFGPAYTATEIAAYRHFLGCATTLVLLSDHQRYTDGRDELGDLVGVGFVGVSEDAWVTAFDDHPITNGVDSLRYLAGAYAVAKDTSVVRFLGWLDGGQPIMGISTATPAKVFFLGDTNAFEMLPQPLLDNLIRWGF